MSEKTYLFTKIGFDLDNNKFGFGINSEIEHTDYEERLSGFIRMRVTEVYLRIWLGRRVVVLSLFNGIKTMRKNRLNIKIVVGVAGVSR